MSAADVLLRVFGMRGDDWERIVVKTCPGCGQPVYEECVLRPLTALEQAVADYEADRIDTSTLERRVAAAIAPERSGASAALTEQERSPE